MLQSEKVLQQLLEKEYQKGVRDGIKAMKQKILLSCENGNPIMLNEEAYFIIDAISNLKLIFDDLEKNVE